MAVPPRTMGLLRALKAEMGWWRYIVKSACHESQLQDTLDKAAERVGFRIIARHWIVEGDRQDLGQGDVIIKLPCDTEVVVETKRLHGGTGRTAKVSRTKARREVEVQADKYAQLWRMKSDSPLVISAILTNDGFFYRRALHKGEASASECVVDDAVMADEV